MNLYARLKSTCEEKGTNVTSVCKSVTGSNGNLDTWKKGHIRSDYLAETARTLGVSTDYLLCLTDDPVPPRASLSSLYGDFEDSDFEDFDTSNFDQPAWQHILEECEYDMKKAVTRYLEFDRAKAEDAALENHEANIYQNNGGTVGVQGHAHALVKVMGGAAPPLSDQEAEILRLFAKLDTVKRAKVLVYAADLISRVVCKDGRP